MLVELGDGSLRGYEYRDPEIAAGVHRACSRRLDAGQPLVFKLRGEVFGASQDAFEPAEVASISVASREVAQARGAWCRKAFALE